jgi:amino acid permease
MNPKYSAMFTSVNMLLGVGPLILPMPFFKAGLVLSTIWITIITVLSYNSTIYIA